MRFVAEIQRPAPGPPVMPSECDPFAAKQGRMLAGQCQPWRLWRPRTTANVTAGRSRAASPNPDKGETSVSEILRLLGKFRAGKKPAKIALAALSPFRSGTAHPGDRTAAGRKRLVSDVNFMKAVAKIRI